MKGDRFGAALVIVAISAFMITMDNTVVNIVKNTIAADLHATDATLEWVVTGYILIFSCLMIPGGRLVDMYGQRLVFSTGMTVFVASSLLAGFSGTIGMLILARVLQGVGAAITLPATMVIVTVGRNDKQRSKGMIVWIGVSSAASALGPGIGAAIKNFWGWQGVFFVNVVPGILVILLALYVLDGAHDSAPQSLDLPGVLTSATMLFAVTYALTEGQGTKLHWGDPAVLSVFALAVIAFISLIIVERWSLDPIFDISFFRNKVFSGAVVSQILMGLGFNGVLFYGVTFMQKVLLFSDLTVALILVAPAAMIGTLTPVSFWLAARLGPKLTIGGGMVLIASGMSLFSTLRQHDGVNELMPGLLVLAAGMALCMPMSMYVLRTVPEERSGVAGGIINVGREMSGALGIAVLGALILSIQSAAQRSGVTDKAESFRQGTAIGLPIGAILVLTGAVVCVVTLPRKRAARAGKHSGRLVPAGIGVEMPETAPMSVVPAEPEDYPLPRLGLSEHLVAWPGSPPPLWPPRVPPAVLYEDDEDDFDHYDPYDPLGLKSTHR